VFHTGVDDLLIFASTSLTPWQETLVSLTRPDRKAIETAKHRQDFSLCDPAAGRRWMEAEVDDDRTPQLDPERGFLLQEAGQ